MLLRKLQTLRLRILAARALANARVSTTQALERTPLAKILVICHGNIYRSALVGEHLRTALGARFQIQSAGFHPVGERAAPQRHVEMCAAKGIDLSSHRSCVVSSEQLAWADLIVLMDRRNWVSLRRAGADESRFVWLGALAPGAVEIADPYELDAGGARAIVQRLLICSEQLAERLLASANVRTSATA